MNTLILIAYIQKIYSVVFVKSASAQHVGHGLPHLQKDKNPKEYKVYRFGRLLDTSQNAINKAFGKHLNKRRLMFLFSTDAKVQETQAMFTQMFT